MQKTFHQRPTTRAYRSAESLIGKVNRIVRNNPDLAQGIGYMLREGSDAAYQTASAELNKGLKPRS